MNPFKTFPKQDDFASRAIAYASPLGCLGIVARDAGHISHLFFTDDFPFDEPSDLRVQYPVLTRIEELLDQYFVGKPFDTATLPLRIEEGTHFQNKVWDAIRRIPHGEVRSYRWIAEKIGNPKAVRAVGSAVGANAISIFVPCHRVIRSDGSLGGYGGGIERKRQLLALEGYQIGAS